MWFLEKQLNFKKDQLMSKQQRESLSEQMKNTGHGQAPFHKEPYQTKEFVEPKNKSKRIGVLNSSIQILAYRLHQEKGGSDLDNWLEAELILSNKH